MILPGWVFSVLILLPNALVLAFPPEEMPAEQPGGSPIASIMEWVERAGQVGCFGTPLFLWGRVSSGLQLSLGLVALGALLVYYVCWARYLLRGRRFSLLFDPLFWLPLPMAVTPVVYFGAVAAVMGSWPLAASTVVFAIGHLYTSRRVSLLLRR